MLITQRSTTATTKNLKRKNGSKHILSICVTRHTLASLFKPDLLRHHIILVASCCWMNTNKKKWKKLNHSHKCCCVHKLNQISTSETHSEVIWFALPFCFVRFTSFKQTRPSIHKTNLYVCSMNEWTTTMVTTRRTLCSTTTHYEWVTPHIL